MERGSHALLCCAGPGIGHTSTVWGLSFEESGERMVSCSDDCTLRVWSCTSKDGEAWWRLLTTASGCHERTIFSVDWSRSGAIASGGVHMLDSGDLLTAEAKILCLSLLYAAAKGKNGVPNRGI